MKDSLKNVVTIRLTEADNKAHNRANSPPEAGPAFQEPPGQGKRQERTEDLQLSAHSLSGTKSRGLIVWYPL